MSCCGIVSGIDFCEMDRITAEVQKFEKDFVCNYEDDHLRKVLKRLRKQYHIDEIAYSGDKGWYFDEDGNMTQMNTGHKHKIRYWHFDPEQSTDPYSGKVKHILVF